MQHLVLDIRISTCFISDVALAIIQSDQWEEAMRLYDEYEEVTPMKLLIKTMPGMCTFCFGEVIKND